MYLLYLFMQALVSTAAKARSFISGCVASKLTFTVPSIKYLANYSGYRAASLGMAMLKAGGSAVDAVEVAIKFFEDHEVTNAGYGSNLTITGAVECDATIVDHLGRSGAVGAVQSLSFLIHIQ